MTTPRKSPPVPVISLVISLVACLMLTVFAWPALHTAPNHLPVALVAPAPVAAGLEQKIEQARPGAFDLKVEETEAAARDAIKNREVYGAILMTPTGPKVLTASAASPAVAQMLGQLPAMMNPQPSGQMEDVVPATLDDPRQAGLSAIGLPLVMGSMLSAVLLTNLYRSSRTRMLGLALAALLIGFGATALLQFWFGSLAGSYLLNSLTVSLGIASLGAFILGMEARFGFAGLGIGAALMMFIGNPFSAIASAPQMLPGSWGAFGQLLPIGAFGTLMRSVSFFDGAGATQPLIVLLCWLTVGVAMTWISSTRKKANASTETVAPDQNAATV